MLHIGSDEAVILAPLMIHHQTDTPGFYVPLYALDAAGVQTFMGHRHLAWVEQQHPEARVIRTGKGRPVRAIIGVALTATGIGGIMGGATFRQHLESGHTCWAMQRARRRRTG